MHIGGEYTPSYVYLMIDKIGYLFHVAYYSVAQYIVLLSQNYDSI